MNKKTMFAAAVLPLLGLGILTVKDYVPSVANIPPDLRDAVGDGGAVEELKGFSGADAPVPVPVPASLAAGPAAQVPGAKFYIGINLDPSVYRGETAAETRANVSKALREKGMTLADYTDSFALSAVVFSTPREENVLGLTSNRDKVEKLLKELPGVAQVTLSGKSGTELSWTVRFRESIYPPGIKRVFSSLTVPHSIRHSPVEDRLNIDIRADSGELSSTLYVLKNLSGILASKTTGERTAFMSRVIPQPKGSITDVLGVGVCRGNNCKVFPR